jgi:predicted nucleotidyltransferase
MAAQRVVSIIRRYLAILQSHGIDARFAVLFGSHARGDADTWSDIDIVVVASHYDTHRTREDVKPLWLLTLEVEPSIEPIACGVEEWSKDDSRPVLEIARNEGIVIRAAG